MLRASALLLLVLGSAGCDGCTREAPPAPPIPRAHASGSPLASEAGVAPARTPGSRELTWSFDATPVGPMQVVLVTPANAALDPPPPILVAFHGRGEAFKGVARGARGWLDDYHLGTAIRRLSAPPLTRDDFLGFVTEQRLSTINAELEQQPYRGLIVACPYTPDILAGDRRFELAAPLAAFVVEQLVPRIQRELLGGRTPAGVGLDGVSLGGRAALLVGFERPRAFAAVGSLQAAFDAAEAPELTRRALAARHENPALAIRLLTSDDDFFRRALSSISRAFEQAGVEHRFQVVPGPHDYAFNRGPGAYEMLLWHERTLRERTSLVGSGPE